MRNYSLKEDLESKIITLFLHVHSDKVQELHWAEIRDALLADFAYGKIAPPPHFNIKLTRILERLRKRGILIKHRIGHKNITYSLDEENNDFSALRPEIGRIGVGTFKPGDTYPEFKKKFMKRIEKVFELEKMYAEAVKHTSKID